ncbi:hypothetical protein FRC04_009551 [Tulasnella sp. 424]|nr:hypothetical protein FRC04_009551 [Tulasnella sp. 424]
MASTRVSFVAPPSTDSGESSLARSALTLESSDETTPDPSELEAIFDDTAHFIVAPERLAVVGEAPTSNTVFEIFLGTLDEASQSPRNVTILTDKRPFDEYGDYQVFYSIVQREAPGQPDMLLSLVADVPKPEYASTLRLLHSYLPLCWEYEPRKRPSISLPRRQVFMFSFEDDAGDSVVATLEELAHLLIPPERLRIVDRSTLGEGNYGEVVLGTLDEASSTPRDVAVKRLKAVGTRGERVRLAKRLARELNIWAKIKHRNVVELIGYYLDEKYESPLLISALMTNGNVLDYIERYKPDIEQRIAFVGLKSES